MNKLEMHKSLIFILLVSICVYFTYETVGEMLISINPRLKLIMYAAVVEISVLIDILVTHICKTSEAKYVNGIMVLVVMTLGIVFFRISHIPDAHINTYIATTNIIGFLYIKKEKKWYLNAILNLVVSIVWFIGIKINPIQGNWSVSSAILVFIMACVSYIMLRGDFKRIMPVCMRLEDEN